MTIQYVSGVRRNYGPRLTENQVGSVVNTLGEVREVVIDFDYAHLPGPVGPVLTGNVGTDTEVSLTGATGTKYIDDLVIVVPSYSQIVAVRMTVLKAFVGGTSLKAGVVNTDNTAATADASTNGLFTATRGAIANLGANAWISGDGALINPNTGTGVGLGAGADTIQGAVGVVIALVAVGTFTAGLARLVVSYVPPILALS